MNNLTKECYYNEDGPMRANQKRILSNYISLVSSQEDREELSKELESGLTCTDADDMIRVLMGETYWK